MRPFKHVAPESADGDGKAYQEILGIDIARFHAPWGEVPIVATAESERIIVFHWNDAASRWESVERPHEPLTFDGDAVDAPNAWNGSERIAIACSASTVYVVYKRQHPIADSGQTAIIVDRYQPESTAPGSGNHRLRLVDTRDLAVVQIGIRDIGRSLWAGCDAETGDLLTLLQVRTHGRLQLQPKNWELILRRDRFDPSGANTFTETTIAEGGFDLDAALVGPRLIAVHRKTPEAFRVPMSRLLGSGLHLTSGTDADPFYEPLQLTTVDLASIPPQPTHQAIPGGEHPQIQRTAPLLITMDRPARLDLALDTRNLPLPHGRPRTIWDEGRMDKVAWLRDGSEVFRGTLLTSDSRTIPRPLSAMSSATHLFENRDGILAHASPFRNFPVHVLAMTRGGKLLTLDVLHHRDFLGLYRTRLRATLSPPDLTVSDRAFEVWDIGHAQIGDPDALDPSADGENAQFDPTGVLAVTASPVVSLGPVPADNTIGGNLAADKSREPVGFFAYSDLGDGGLRVVFAPDIPALADPPPIGDEKTLRPEQVTGPHLRCDEWIELHAPDYIDSGLIAYSVGLLETDRSLGSSMEVPIDFLLDACDIITADHSGPGGLPLDPLAGLTRQQLVAVDTKRGKGSAPLVVPLTVSDGRNVTVTIDPGVLIADAPVSLSVNTGGTTPNVLWTLTSLDAGLLLPPGPILPGTAGVTPGAQVGAGGNPANIAALFSGRWRLSVFLTELPNPAGASIDLQVLPSTFDTLTSLYDQVSEGDLYRMSDLNLSAFQYEIDYVADDTSDVTSVAIVPKTKRTTELRFSGGGPGQGIVDSRTVLYFSTEEMKFKLGLDLLFLVQAFDLTIRYGRRFTPGMLMRDRRSRDPLNGDLLGEKAFDLVDRRDALHHAAIGSKPIGDASVSGHDIGVQIGMNPLGMTAAALIPALGILGLFSIAQIIVELVGAGAAAIALGMVGIAAAVVAAIALAVFIAVVVPPAVESVVVSQVERRFSSGEILDQLNQQPILRFGGEGAAEAIARKTLDAARALGLNVPAPAALDSEEAGRDRFYGQIFQMIFVSHGVCRVLIRLDDCHDNVSVPPPPDTPGNGGDPPGTTRGFVRAG